jgi:hypothetical protein
VGQELEVSLSDEIAYLHEGFYSVVLCKNLPATASLERGEWWLASDARPWQPDAGTVVRERLAFRPRLTPVA